MTTFPGSPRLLKGGIVLIDADTSAVQRIIVLQYNPDTLTRKLQPQATGQDGGDRSEALRIKAPPVETITLEAEIDATDQLEQPDRNPDAVQLGIHPQLAALETIVYPSSAALTENNRLAQSGTLEGWRSRARWRSSRWRRRSRCSCGARRGCCRCASPTSASPKRRSTRR